MKKGPDFMEGLRKVEERHAVQRQAPEPEAPAAGRIPSRRGKVSIGHWVDPAVRRQLAQIALDRRNYEYELVNEALNLLFEKYGEPPIA